MKYSVVLADSDEVLGTVERIDGEAGPSWKFETAAGRVGAGQTLEDSCVDLTRGGIVCRGDKRVFLASSPVSPDGAFWVATPLGNFKLQARRGAEAGTGASGGKGAQSIKSSMPGKVLKLLCQEGAAIEAGQPLLIIEAMKMENEIRAPRAGHVESIKVQPGQKIESGELLIVLK